MSLKDILDAISREVEKDYVIADRPKIKSTWLLADSQKYLEKLHHGIAEFKSILSCLYPFLNLTELLAFAYNLQRREESVEEIDDGYASRMKEDYVKTINAMHIEELLVYLGRGAEFVKKRLELSEKQELEPYSTSYSKRVEEFLKMLDKIDKRQEFEQELRKKMCEVPITWCFDCEYEKIVRQRGGNNYRLKVMEFMPKYPKDKDEHIKRYAKEIAKILNTMPSFYLQFKKPLQLKLFKP
jgi:hypothetical protein